MAGGAGVWLFYVQHQLKGLLGTRRGLGLTRRRPFREVRSMPIRLTPKTATVVLCRMGVRLRFPTTLLKMQRMFPDEKAAAAYLRAVRWPDGFACRHCGWQGDPYVFENRPTVLRCRKCHHDTSITSNTCDEGYTDAVAVWFWAAYLVTTQTPGESGAPDPTAARSEPLRDGIFRYSTNSAQRWCVRDIDRIGRNCRSRWMRLM